MPVQMRLPKNLNLIKKNVGSSIVLIRRRRNEFHLDENATDLDFDENHSTSISSPTKPSLSFPFPLNDHAYWMIRNRSISTGWSCSDGCGFQRRRFEFDRIFSHLIEDILSALTFKATTEGVIHNLGFSIELMQKREEIWRRKYDKVNHLKKDQWWER